MSVHFYQSGQHKFLRQRLKSLLTGLAGLLKNGRPFKNERVGVRRQIVSNLKKRHSVILPVQSSPLSFLEQT